MMTERFKSTMFGTLMLVAAGVSILHSTDVHAAWWLRIIWAFCGMTFLVRYFTGPEEDER